MAYSDGDLGEDRSSTNGSKLETACEHGKDTRLKGHPLLTTWRPPRAHPLSAAQFEVLTAICDTVVPSLPPPFKDGEVLECMKGVTAEDIKEFYNMKASDEGVIDVVAGLLLVVMRPSQWRRLLSAIGLLTTGWGTFILGLMSGVNTFSFRYPFFIKFSTLSEVKRERMLQGWSRSSQKKLRQMFMAFKSATAWSFYSKIDEEGKNPAWKAIGYHGPDQVVKSRTKSDQKLPSPLGDKHIDVKETGGKLKSLLTDAGCFLVKDFSDLRKLEVHKDNRENENDICIECDVAIVGSGSGGGVMAAALAKQGLKVVVLEAGHYFTAQDITTLEGPGMVNMYERMGGLSTDDGGIALIAGRTVGGGSAVNWCVCFKTPENVRNEWVEEYGLDLFTSERYDQAMEVVWERLGVQPEVDKHSPQNSVLQAGSQKLGLHHGTLQRNCTSDHYCGWCSYGCPTGKKQSTAVTWLVDAVNTGNALVLSNCKVEQVLYTVSRGGKKGKKSQGVVALIGDGSNRLFVKARATVVACGSLMTPPLLLSSGLKNPNIGKYLRLHPASTLWGYFPEGTGPEGTFYEGGIMTVYSPVAYRKPGEYGGLLETGTYHPSVFAAFHAWRSGADGKERMMRHGRTSHITVVTRDKDYGTITLDKEGHIVYRYDISEYDEESLVAGMVQSLRVLIAAGAVEVGTQQLDGERFKIQGASTAEIEAYLTRVQRRGAKNASLQLASAHQLGSCRMGRDPENSAVDPRGETWEVEGLFVGDGSVLPTSSGVNPMVTIQSIAYCTADAVAQFLKSS